MADQQKCQAEATRTVSLYRGGPVTAGAVPGLMVSISSYVLLWASMTLCAGLFVFRLTLVLVEPRRRQD